MLKSRYLVASALAGSLVPFAAPGYAQVATPIEEAIPQSSSALPGATDAPPAANADGSDDVGTIVVTGSRIRSPNLTSTVPITVLSAVDLVEKTSQISVGETLNELPQLRSTFGLQNGTRFLGTRGLNLLDLRGLGPQRTLVLVNGRRHVASDILSNGVSPDTNTFPTDLIERVDILTGGTSSIYGSDAIAGTVNFVLKQDYEGFEVRGRGGVSTYGDAGSYQASVLAGKNFADDRGNVAVNFEYSRQERYFVTGRRQQQVDGLVVVDTDPAGTPNGSDGVADRQFFRDIRSATSGLGGIFALAQRRGAAGCGSDVLGNPFTCVQRIQPDGTLTRQTGTRIGIGPNGSFVGGDGYSGREGELLALSPQLQRYNANIIAHFDVSDAFKPFIEAKYARTEAFGSQSGPFFNSGQEQIESSSAALGYNRERVRLDNPYLPAATRAALTQQILAAGVDPNSTGTNPAALTPAQRAAIADGSFRLTQRRTFLDLGIRDEKLTRETYRIVGGVRGDFNEDWNYEFSVNYGEFREKNLIQNNVSSQRFVLANDTARNAAGQIVCRAQIDPTAAGVDFAGNPAQLAADIAACVPLNPFGEGSVSEAARRYVSVDTRAEGKITQFVVSGSVSGDSSQLFELPGGPVGFALGGEYRRETNYYDLDDYTQAGYAFYNAIPTFRSPAFEVKEAFGELRLPILRDVPFFQELTLTGSGRVADYKGATGTVYTYGGGADWAPVQGMRFRGSYSRAIRAPNLQERFSPQGQNFTPATITDPCSARNIGAGTTNRATNCAAAGAPAGYDYVFPGSLEIVSGGNPDLREEKSDSYTAGVVVQPAFIPGLSVSVDYFDITVKNVITSVSAQQILDQCYDLASLNNQFCASFQRAGAGGGANGEIPFQVLRGSLLQSSLNFAKNKVRGVDTTFSYRRDLGFGALSLGATWTRTLQRDDFTDPTNPSFTNRILGELGDPKNQVNFDASLKAGKVTFGYQLRWIDKMYINTYEDQFGLNGLPPGNADYAFRNYYPDVFYHDVRLAVEVNDRFNAYLGVDNVTNRQPPLGLTGVASGIDGNGGGGIYDVRGRYPYVGITAKF